MKSVSIIAIAVSSFLVGMMTLTTCITRPGAPAGPTSTDMVPAAQAEAMEPWQKEWERIKIEARKERFISIWASDIQRHEEVTKQLKEKYGIEVAALAGGSGGLTQKILAERRAGIYSVDIFHGGMTTMTTLKNQGTFDSIKELIILPEVLDPKVWWGGELGLVDTGKRYILSLTASNSVPWTINTDLVHTEPRRWEDLLKPEWKGKIIFRDPRKSGAPQTIFSLIANWRPDLGLDYWRKFVKQEPVLIDDQRLVATWLAQGKFALGIGVDTTTVQQFQQVGAPLKNVNPEGIGTLSSGSGIIGLVNKAPHPNAAKLYVNYILTKEAQYMFSRGSGYQSRRLDVPTDHLEPDKIRNPKSEYIDTSREDIAEITMKTAEKAIEIFGSR